MERIGLPEARIILSQAATYVASAPKSNAAYVAVDEAQEAVRLKGNFTVPSHLRDCHYSGAEKLGHGDGYKYAHDYPEPLCEAAVPCRMDWRAAHFTARQKMGMRRRLGSGCTS